MVGSQDGAGSQRSTGAVLFDLDGTLFDRDEAVRGIVAWQVRAFAHVIPDARAAEFCSRVIELDAYGHRDKREVFATIGDEFTLRHSIVRQLVDSFWEQYPHRCRMSPDDRETLEELRRLGKRLGIVTNGASSVQNATIDALGIRGYFDAILISESEGIRKPQREIFLRALARIESTPDAACFVGDHPLVDVAGAEAAGLRAIWRRTVAWTPRADVTTIETLSDILRII